jgi:hypothetical protein
VAALRRRPREAPEIQGRPRAPYLPAIAGVKLLLPDSARLQDDTYIRPTFP